MNAKRILTTVMMLTESVPILSGPSLVLAKKDTKATEFDVDVSNTSFSSFN